MIINAHHFKDSQEAYLELNKFFLNHGGTVLRDIVSGQVISYDTLVKIDKAWVDPKFDFGNTFGYRRQKWSGLINNYLDLKDLEELKADVLEKEKKKGKHYNVSMAFSNNHAHGKNCLLSLTATRRYNKPNPILSFTLRSSEITKRLLMDLLLIQRIGEYIYGRGVQVELNMFVINMYQDPEAFCMLDSVVPLKKLLEYSGKKKTPYQKKIMKILKRLKTVNVEDVKYKVHKRCVRQLQRPDGKPLSGDRPMYAKQLEI